MTYIKFITKNCEGGMQTASMTVIDSHTVFNRNKGGSVRMLDSRLTITEVAKQLGVTTKTITRWEKAGKIKPAKRDWRGWRAYSEEELLEMKNLIQTVY